MANLTKRAVDAAKPGETLWDDDLPGFGVRVGATGTKAYVVKFRANGRQRWMTLGRHGVLTPEEARREARRVLGDVAKGGDPAADRAKARRGVTLADFAVRYQSDYSAHHKKPASRAADAFHFKNHLLPKFGAVRLDALTRQEVARFHAGLSDRPTTANRCIALLSHVYTVAARWGEVPEGCNPCKGLVKYKEAPRERYLSAEEITRLARACADAEAAGSNPFGIAAIRLLLLTGARLNEIVKCRWEWVDFDARVIRLPDSKTGKKLVALPPPALTILANLPRLHGNAFVIPGRIEGQPFADLHAPWRRVTKLAGLRGLRIHDLRHTWAATAVTGGASLHIIGAVLGHTQSRTTERYSHVAADPRLAAADSVANRIAAAMEGGGGEIIIFRNGSKT